MDLPMGEDYPDEATQIEDLVDAFKPLFKGEDHTMSAIFQDPKMTSDIIRGTFGSERLAPNGKIRGMLMVSQGGKLMCMDVIRTSKNGSADLGLMDLGLTQNITEHFNKKRNGKKKGGVVKRNTALENKASDSMMIPGHFNTPHVVAHTASGDAATSECVYSIHYMLFPNPEQLTSEYKGNVQCYPLTPIVIPQKQIKESMQRLRAKHSLHQAGKYVYFTSEDVRNIQASDSLTFKYEDVIIHLQYTAEVEAWTWHAMQSFVSKNEVIFPSTKMLNLSSDDLNGVQNLWEKHLKTQVLEVIGGLAEGGGESAAGPTKALGKASTERSGEGSDEDGSDDNDSGTHSRSSSTSSSTSTTVHGSSSPDGDDWLDGCNLSGSAKAKAGNKDGSGAGGGTGGKGSAGSGKKKKKKKKK
jgi:hypothetical protein